MSRDFVFSTLILSLVIIFFLTLIWVGTSFPEERQETIEVLDLGCLQEYAKDYCNNSVRLDDNSFNCIENNNERENYVELSTLKYFLDAEKKHCTILQLNFRETGR